LLAAAVQIIQTLCACVRAAARGESLEMCQENDMTGGPETLAQR